MLCPNCGSEEQGTYKVEKNCHVCGCEYRRNVNEAQVFVPGTYEKFIENVIQGINDKIMDPSVRGALLNTSKGFINEGYKSLPELIEHLTEEAEHLFGQFQAGLREKEDFGAIVEGIGRLIEWIKLHEADYPDSEYMDMGMDDTDDMSHEGEITVTNPEGFADAENAEHDALQRVKDVAHDLQSAVSDLESAEDAEHANVEGEPEPNLDSSMDMSATLDDIASNVVMNENYCFKVGDNVHIDWDSRKTWTVKKANGKTNTLVCESSDGQVVEVNPEDDERDVQHAFSEDTDLVAERAASSEQMLKDKWAKLEAKFNERIALGPSASMMETASVDDGMGGHDHTGMGLSSDEGHEAAADKSHDMDGEVTSSVEDAEDESDSTEFSQCCDSDDTGEIWGAEKLHEEENLSERNREMMDLTNYGVLVSGPQMGKVGSIIGGKFNTTAFGKDISIDLHKLKATGNDLKIFDNFKDLEDFVQNNDFTDDNSFHALGGMSMSESEFDDEHDLPGEIHDDDEDMEEVEEGEAHDGLGGSDHSIEGEHGISSEDGLEEGEVHDGMNGSDMSIEGEAGISSDDGLEEGEVHDGMNGSDMSIEGEGGISSEDGLNESVLNTYFNDTYGQEKPVPYTQDPTNTYSKEVIDDKRWKPDCHEDVCVGDDDDDEDVVGDGGNVGLAEEYIPLHEGDLIYVKEDFETQWQVYGVAHNPARVYIQSGKKKNVFNPAATSWQHVDGVALAHEREQESISHTQNLWESIAHMYDGEQEKGLKPINESKMVEEEVVEMSNEDLPRAKKEEIYRFVKETELHKEQRGVALENLTKKFGNPLAEMEMILDDAVLAESDDSIDGVYGLNEMGELDTKFALEAAYKQMEEAGFNDPNSQIIEITFENPQQIKLFVKELLKHGMSSSHFVYDDTTVSVVMEAIPDTITALDPDFDKYGAGEPMDGLLAIANKIKSTDMSNLTENLDEDVEEIVDIVINTEEYWGNAIMHFEEGGLDGLHDYFMSIADELPVDKSNIRADTYFAARELANNAEQYGLHSEMNEVSDNKRHESNLGMEITPKNKRGDDIHLKMEEDHIDLTEGWKRGGDSINLF